MPKELSIKLARQILTLSERGIKTNKADLFIKLAEYGLEEQVKREAKA